MVERGYIGKDPNSTSLKFKVITRCGDSKLSTKAMISYLGITYLITNDCDLEGLEAFASTKWKLHLPLGTNCDS